MMTQHPEEDFGMDVKLKVKPWLQMWPKLKM